MPRTSRKAPRRSIESPRSQPPTDSHIPPVHDPGSPEFKLLSSPFYLIALADFRFHEDLDKALARLRIDRSTYRVLTVLRNESPATIKDVAERALLKRSTASRIVDRMRDDNLVTTRANGDDNRLTDVKLTERGRTVVEHAMRYGSRQLHRAMDGVSESEVTGLVALLQRITANLSKLSID